MTAQCHDARRGSLRRRRLVFLIGTVATIVLAGLTIGGPGIRVSQ